MDIKLGSAHLALARDELVRIENARGAWVRCAEGVLWVTQDKDRQDYFMGPGQALRIESNGPTLVHAMRRATFRIEHAAGADNESLETWWNPFARSASVLRLAA